MPHELLQTIEKEHLNIKELLHKIENKSARAVKTKDDLFMKLKRELIPHMKGEEKHFYPLLMNKKAGKQVGMEAMEEHHAAEMLLKELDQLPTSEENWDAKFAVFAEILRHHIQEEEDNVFDAAQEVLETDELDKAMSAYVEEKKSYDIK
ncbi:Hemerythrin HHE cation binding domain-containing protein [Desulfonatronum thiosulfatophilum]|uniref:Hemerythrin HHE cation binding domain-containing protein n=1 Tax=Desulfonatronum thiosulfatophilum TaxID=617002 RepID=A0A1G6AIA6_9BACT|nr:hemerythrin domain-containing protein [Desulfonatronum thiosulfatophilum]SDB08161.1 Hemerythrin HHE cation binding domain-containing protein [Desulfonatronum thiosulfatophilum]